MLAGLLLGAWVLAAPPAAPTERPTLAVVITGHEGLTFRQALDLARRLSAALGASGMAAPLDPQAIVDQLGGRNPEACGSRSACLADLAHALRVSALVTLDAGKVVGDFAFVVALVDGRDGRKLLERTSSSAPANLDAAMLPLATELARVASALPGPSAVDAPFRSTRPDLEPSPLNFGAPTLLSGGGAVAAGGVALGFLVAAGLQWLDLGLHTRTYSGPLPPGYSPNPPLVVDYSLAQTNLMYQQLGQRLTISLLAGAGSAVLTGVATYFLFQPPPPAR